MSEVLDRLAKMAANGVSRRDVLKGLGAVLTGGFLFGFAGRVRANNAAFCKQCCAHCTGAAHGHCIAACKQCLKKNRKPCCSTTTCGVACCQGGAACCTTPGAVPVCCPPKTSNGVPQACCKGACVTLNSSSNCGACGKVCPPGTACVPNSVGGYSC